MLKIIDGFRFDTTKATPIGSASAKCAPNAMHWWAETLYRTPRAGRFFIHLKWHCLGEVKEGIKPVPAATARGWCQLYLEGEAWQKYFTED